jgi:hypothetical protein
MVDWVVSHSDVEKHPQYGKISLDQILFSYGMNVSQGYVDDGRWLEGQDVVAQGGEEVEAPYDFLHRSLFTGEVSKGPRYTGKARQDGKWKRFVSNFLELPTG